MKSLGLIVGGGTGPELAQVFRTAVGAFSDLVGTPFDVVECPQVFRSFTELYGLSSEACRQIVDQDRRSIAGFYRDFYSEGGRRLFRTAVNAETLYAVRRDLQAVKVSHATLGTSRITFIRDQFQGFYSNEGWSGGEHAISFQASFSREGLKQIYEFGRREAAGWLGATPEVWFVYKHHLFANSFVHWIESVCPEAAVLQPGMAYSKLTGRSSTGGQPVLLIAGNEIGDMLQEIFIGFSARESRETAWSRNVYLHPEVVGLEEYQTVHGSADDIGGMDRVNPVATLRAAAALLGREMENAGLEAALEQAIAGSGSGKSDATAMRARNLLAATAEIYGEADFSDSKIGSSFAASSTTAGGSRIES